jgi:hypothetical protein
MIKEVMQYKKYESGQGASDGDDAPEPSFAGRTRKKDAESRRACCALFLGIRPLAESR